MTKNFRQRPPPLGPVSDVCILSQSVTESELADLNDVTLVSDDIF